jgi:hypothetical protein
VEIWGKTEEEVNEETLADEDKNGSQRSETEKEMKGEG